MSENGPGEVTRILQSLGWDGRGRCGGGDPGRDLFALIYAELRALAAQKMARDGAVLSPTSLVHQAYMRLIGDPEGIGNIQWQSRAHFFSAAAEAMRRILIDHARAIHAQKRGGDLQQVPLDSSIIDLDTAGRTDVLDLDQALQRLEANDGRMADVVKLRFFAGLTIEQTALAVGVSTRTINRDWNAAKAWLHSELQSMGALLGE